MPGSYLYITCFKCQKKYLKEGNLNGLPLYKVRNFSMDGITQIICPECQDIILSISQEMLYEIYFQTAVEQFVDKNYAESVFFLTKSRETFIKYIIELLLYEKNSGIDIEDIWSKGVALSERRLGAFFSLFFYRFGEFLDLNKIETNLRNKVMHDSVYPTEEDTIKYADNILNLFNTVMKKILEEIDLRIIMSFNRGQQKKKIDACLKKFKDRHIQIQYASDSIISRNTFSKSEEEQNTRREIFSKKYPDKWKELACQANKTGKIIYINEQGAAELKNRVEDNEPKIYQPTQSFEKLVEIISQRKKRFDNHSITLGI